MRLTSLALALTALLACGPTEPNTTDESTSASTTDTPNTSGDAPTTTGDTPTTTGDTPVVTTTTDPGSTTAASDDCEALGEAQCAAAGCTPISGAPHVMMGDAVCVDFEQPVFLGCLEGGIACPPSVPTVCPEGQPDMAFDVPSGCLPPGHIFCDAPAPACP